MPQGLVRSQSFLLSGTRYLLFVQFLHLVILNILFLSARVFNQGHFKSFLERGGA